jgi:uncharacterized membrane protein required for colicin V production
LAGRLKTAATFHQPLNLFCLFPDSLPQLSLGTAALIVFSVCAGFVLLRGITRMIIGTAVLGVSVWIAFRVWQIAPSLSIEWTGKSPAWITNGLPVAALLVSFFVIRLVVNAVIRPFHKPQGNSIPRTLAGTVSRLVFALVPTALICTIVAIITNHAAAVADVRASSAKAGGLPDAAPASFSQRLRSAVEAKVPGKWLRILDPLTDPSRVALAKLIAAQSESPLAPVINPETGKPIPRAIIVDDPALQKLAREGKFDTLLRHPLLTKALADPKIQNLLRDLSH